MRILKLEMVMILLMVIINIACSGNIANNNATKEEDVISNYPIKETIPQDTWQYIYTLSRNTIENRKEIDRLYFNATFDNPDFLAEVLAYIFRLMEDHGKEYLIKSITTRKRLDITLPIIISLGKYSPVVDEILLVKNDNNIYIPYLIKAISCVGKATDNVHQFIVNILRSSKSNNEIESALECIIDMKMFDQEVLNAIIELYNDNRINKKQMLEIIARSSWSIDDKNNEVIINIVKEIYNNENDEENHLLAAACLMRENNINIDHFKLIFNDNQNNNVKLFVSLLLLKNDDLGTYLTNTLSSDNEIDRLTAYWACNHYYQNNCIYLLEYWIKGLNDKVDIQKHSMQIINKMNSDIHDRDKLAKLLLLKINAIDPFVTWDLLKYIDENIKIIDDESERKLNSIYQECNYLHIKEAIADIISKK